MNSTPFPGDAAGTTAPARSPAVGTSTIDTSAIGPPVGADGVPSTADSDRSNSDGAPSTSDTQASISRSFFERPVLDVAPDVLGGILSRRLPGLPEVAIRITEVEAYDGRIDPASHAYRGRTPRNASMFGPPGHLYCYFIYGIHYSLNLVCEPEGEPTGLLVRAGEVVAGRELARERRSVRRRTAPTDRELARGPGCVAQAFGATTDSDGADLFGGEWSFTPPGSPAAFTVGPRVGVSGPGADPEAFPWRFSIPGDPTVSAFVKGRG